MVTGSAPQLTARDYAPGAVPFMTLFWLSMRAHTVFFVLVALYMACELVMSLTRVGGHDASFSKFIVVFASTVLPIFLLAIVTLRFCRLAIYERPPHPLKALLQDLKAFFGSPQRLANGLPVVMMMFLLMRTFGAFKANIPYYNGFSWDETFMELDRTLHFGVDPWVILQPVLGFPIVTFIVNFIYNFWFMAMWIIWMWLAFSNRHSHLRLQFFLAFALCWAIGGSLLAIGFSSAGPCYYGFVVPGADPFAPLMSYLYGVNETFPVWALDTQTLLWDGYLEKQDLVVGISAMPSMHNATAVMFALVGWRTSRGLGIALTAFAACILIGSVHLGWHYAVDGYFGIALGLLVWWLCGKFVTWYEKRDHMVEYIKAMS
jgi:hypothetical protein